jgi:recombination protein RecT
MSEETTRIKVHAYPTLLRMEDLLGNIIPAEMCVKRLIRLFYVELAKNPTLNSCSTESICGAIMSCAQYGLEPGIAGMVYLIPRGGKAAFMLGYRGMIELSRRSGTLTSIEASCVYEKDHFKIKKGTRPDLDHEPAIIDRGEIIGVYAVVTLKDGSKQFDFMNMSDISAVRGRSATRNSGPWVTDFEQMAQKTVIRRLLKLAPISVSLSSAISLDEACDYSDQGLEMIGREAMVSVEPAENIIDIQSQSDKLADRLGTK